MTELQHLQQVLLSMAKDIDRLCRDNGIRYHLNGGSAIGAVRHHGFIPWDDDYDIEMTPSNYYRFIEVCRQQLDPAKYYVQEGLKDWPMDSTKIKLLGTRFGELESHADDESHKGIFVDVFRIDHAAPTRLGRLWQYVCAKYRLCYLLSKRTYRSATLPKRLMMLLAAPQRIGFIRRYFERQQTGYNNRPTGYYGLLTQRTKYPHCIVKAEAVATTCYMPFEDTQLPVAGNYDEYLSTIFGNYMQLPPEDQRHCGHLESIDFGPY